MTAIDTSVAVAALLSWHELHDECTLPASGASIPAHALVETYSVLTRLPAPHRISHSDARALLEARFTDTAILVMNPPLQRTLIATLSDAGISGGSTYDGLIALIARDHGHPLLTADRRAARTYESLGVEYQLVPAAEATD